MYKTIILLGMLYVAYGAERAMTFTEIDALTSGIFDTPPTKPNTQIQSTTPKKDGENKTCLTIENKVGECVPYYHCNVTQPATTTEDYGTIDLHFTDLPCQYYSDTCCLPGDIFTEPPKVKTEEPKKLECGRRNEKGIGFLLNIKNGSDETHYGEFPWVVAILKLEPVDEKDPESQKEVYTGSGTLIHPGVVLTAAHVILSKNSPIKKLRVRAGEWDSQTTKELYPHQDRNVEKVEMHQDYNKGALYYDIALLFLTEPFELIPNVGVACLPPANVRTDEGTRCFATGWGKDKFGMEGRYQNILKKVEVPVVERKECLKRLQNTRLGTRFTLHSSFMCAGGEGGRDTCVTDGGAPLVCPIQYEPGRYMQSGIVAWGIGCGDDSSPGVYVDVANLRDWVDDKVAGRGINPAIYTY